MPVHLKAKNIDPAMADDTELAAEALSRSTADTILETNITNEATARISADANIQTQVTTNENSISNIISTFMANVRATTLASISFITSTDILETDTILQALGKIQAKLTGHFGSGGNSHADATQLIDGFMVATDKVKLDNALGRIASQLISGQTLASNTTFTDIGSGFIWTQSEATLIKSGSLKYYVMIGNRNLDIRVVNKNTGAILGVSEAISTSGFYNLAITLPTTDCQIGIQVLKSSTGGESPTLEATQLEFSTI